MWSDYGFAYSHHNLYEYDQRSDVMHETYELFRHEDSKELMEDLSGRDCSGDYVEGAPSRYFPGDFSLPHTDHMGERSVAFVWHLTKVWRSEWGGALYWCAELQDRAYFDASFNTLHLFSVTARTQHFVTAVNPEAPGKRLAFNGWYRTSYVVDEDDPLEEWYATTENQLTLSNSQSEDLVMLNLEDVAPERREKLSKVQRSVRQLLNPDHYAAHVVDGSEEDEEYWTEDDEGEEDMDEDENEETFEDENEDESIVRLETETTSVG